MEEKTLACEILPSHRFVLTPRPLKHLRKYMRDVTWNSTTKMLIIHACETPKFEIYEWLEYIRKQTVENKKGPFVDLDKDALTLQMLGQDTQECVYLKFKNLSVVDHTCTMACNDSHALIYHITLGYQEMDIEKKEKATDDPVSSLDVNRISDEEWQAETHDKPCWHCGFKPLNPNV